MEVHRPCSGPVRGSSSRGSGNFVRKRLKVESTVPGVLTGSKEILVLQENRRHSVKISPGFTPAPLQDPWSGGRAALGHSSRPQQPACPHCHLQCSVLSPGEHSFGPVLFSSFLLQTADRGRTLNQMEQWIGPAARQQEGRGTKGTVLDP